jgi:hypothetical protein
VKGDQHFPGGFRQELCGLDILEDGRQHDVELKHGDTAELFYTLRPRREGLNERMSK